MHGKHEDHHRHRSTSNAIHFSSDYLTKYNSSNFPSYLLGSLAMPYISMPHLLSTTPIKNDNQNLLLKEQEKIMTIDQKKSINHNEYLLISDQSILNETGDISSMVIPNRSQSSLTELFGTNETRNFLVQYLNQHPMFKSFFVGAFSGTCSTLLFQPFDLLKTRVQNAHFSVVGGRNVSTQTTTKFVPIMFDVIKNEHVIGLWRGTAPSLFRCVPGVAIHFSCLETLKNHFCTNRVPSSIEAMFLGMISRSIAAIVLIPVTVIKTRYESGIYFYKNITDALRHTYRSEGLRGLKSGLLPTLMRDVPFSGLYFMFYSQLKNAIALQNEMQPNLQQYSKFNMISSSSLTFLCGLSAGLMASVVTQPMDVVKTRMQMNSKQFPTFIYTTLFIIKQEKFRGLFAGLVPRTLRRTLMATMAWTVYEQIMKSLYFK